MAHSDVFITTSRDGKTYLSKSSSGGRLSVEIDKNDNELMDFVKKAITTGNIMAVVEYRKGKKSEALAALAHEKSEKGE